jgi:hypothetical protein
VEADLDRVVDEILAKQFGAVVCGLLSCMPCPHVGYFTFACVHASFVSFNIIYVRHFWDSDRARNDRTQSAEFAAVGWCG